MILPTPSPSLIFFGVAVVAVEIVSRSVPCVDAYLTSSPLVLSPVVPKPKCWDHGKRIRSSASSCQQRYQSSSLSSSFSMALQSKSEDEEDNDNDKPENEVIEWSDFDGIEIGSDVVTGSSENNEQDKTLTFNIENVMKSKRKNEEDSPTQPQQIMDDLPDFDFEDDSDDDGKTTRGKNDNNPADNPSSSSVSISDMLLERKRGIIDSNDDDNLGGVGEIRRRRQQRDLTGVTTRQFSLGEDLILTDFVGNLGFEEVVDWEYYYENEDDPDERKVVQPNPFDSSKPKRTRTSSGSVVRIFRGEWVGRLGATLRSRGLDRRLLVKEYTGKLALALAEREQAAMSKLQSELVEDDDEATGGDWIQAASSRSVLARKDDSFVGELLTKLSTAPFVGSVGEVNLAELDGEMDPNDFYRALGVPPPKPDAVWVLYEYVGFNTVATYTALPPEIRRSQQPPKKNFFGTFQDPAPLPPFRTRANYIINGIMKGAIVALATLHESGMAHRSIGRNSLVLTASDSQDKREPSTIYFTRTAGLSVKLTDFGFSGPLEDSALDPEFISRARSFGFSFRKGEQSLDVTNFAMAEDLHALGFVFLGLLLTSLAELPNDKSPMPKTDEDTLQRLLGEIFSKDFQLFREYVEEEDVWNNLVELLDDNNGAGWNILESLFNAREKIAEKKDSMQLVTARGLLSSPFFQTIR